MKFPKEEKINIDFKIPASWAELSDKQLRFVFSLMADEFNTDEIKCLCFLKWARIEVIGKQDSGAYLLHFGKMLFEIEPIRLAELFRSLDWLGSLPAVPVSLRRIHRYVSLPPDFQGVDFKSFIIADNLYQGYLATQNEELLQDLAEVLYGKSLHLDPAEKISIFWWMASLKEFLAKKFPDFFQPASESPDGNLLGSSQSVEDAMNAQIRALTKGDITKEEQILSLDTWRALTELNAQAREYKELNAKMKS